jgi:hypothetical protein
MSKLCPSAQPGMDNCSVLGVVQQDNGQTVVVYAEQRISATKDVLALTSPLKPTEVFRLSATCAERRCPHFDGNDCRLATRIVRILPAVVDDLPRCTIRSECRWFSQEGSEACRRCPSVTTITYNLSEQTREVSGLPVAEY